MKRERSENKRLGPAAAAMRRRNVFRDTRTADSQISVDGILRDAVTMQRFHAPSKTSSARVIINSPEELAVYRQKRRAELEESVRRGYKFIGNWTKYARWEAQQGDFERMRSILERAIPVHGDTPTLWRDYAELEETHGFVEHARLVWSRGVTALPSCVDLWLKYLLLEQAAGSEQKVREVFNRWIAGDARHPSAYELFAFYEAQAQQQEACRGVLRRYVEAENSPQAWLFYYQTERHVFGELPQAIKVLQTALQALPEVLLWGPTECRVPLALAEALAAGGHVDEARRTYVELLHRARDSALADDVLSAYSRFEQLQGENGHQKALSCLQARQLYERRLERNPKDFDSYLSLYLLLRDAARSPPEEEEGKGGGSASSSSALTVVTRKAEGEVRGRRDMETALSCLRRAEQTPAPDPYSAQQRAVLVMELARRAEEEGLLTEARTVLANTIKTFPFDLASCPRLWLEAARLEERHGDYEQARKLLQAASHVVQEASIFDAVLELETRAFEAGVLSKAAYLDRARAVYQGALKTFPENEQLWTGFARLEEREVQFARAQALYEAGIRTLTAAASRTLSFTQRYAFLGKVDALWARRIALQTRLLRRAEDAREEEAKAVQGLEAVYAALLRAVWADYRFEAIAWRSKEERVESGREPPATLPDLLAPAVARWAEAVEAVSRYTRNGVRRRRDAAGAPPSPAAADTHEERRGTQRFAFMRDLMKSLVEEERGVLRRSLGVSGETSFDDAQLLHKWAELLLSPLLGEWGKWEALYGGSLATVRLVASEPVKRRTRLFARRS